MRDDVYLLGAGQTPVGKHEATSVGALAITACRHALKDAGVGGADAVFVGNMLSSHVTGQSHLGPLIASAIGRGAEAVMINAACASGAAAVRQAYLAVASGAYEIVVAVGVEKMTGLPRQEITRLLATAADLDREVRNEATFVALNALLMRRYMHEYGVGREDFAVFAQVAHENGVTNENARLRFPLTDEEYLGSRMVADPIGVCDASPIADGAAAVVLASSPQFAAQPERAIRILGSAAATDTLSLQERADLLWLQAAEDSASAALYQANKTAADIDLFELHDAFTIISALSLEACGFAPRGGATQFAREQGVDRAGQLPISTFGGLKSRGHPVGASGAYQVVEAALQLRGEAGVNQVASPRVAMTQSIGGSGATVITHVLELAS